MTLVLWLIGIALLVIWLGVVAIGPPFVPTLKHDINAIFEALNIGSYDHVVDFGAGDGRVLEIAAKRGAAVSGVEINPFLVGIAKWRLRQLKGSVTLGNMWKYRLPDDTTHVFVFAAEVFMNKLERYLVSERSHTDEFWVMCYGFRFKGKEPEKVIGAFNLYRF